MSTDIETGSIYESEDFVREMVSKWFDFNAAKPEFAELGTEVSFSDASEGAQEYAYTSLCDVIKITALAVERDMELRLTPHADDVGEIYQRADDDWGFRIKAGNGEQIGGGEGYTRQEDAERGLNRLRSDITDIRYVSA